MKFWHKLKQSRPTCNTVGSGALLVSSLGKSSELRVAQANGSYVEWFGEKIVQSSPGSAPQAVSPARVNRSIGDPAFSAAS
jgi:hypothetical protein